ncbi:LIMLP_15305 family protein [Leptospira kanakyensis]|uniref:Uncharacterized protein n=1 Tax=Leptospira kanakyensis TaxID=2484968 RepID=A0A6N4QAT1_9LEPT|nr:hypothetical protein [Leptospira kanakyensis]MCW7469306.1 hypothetical protein [Leptospira kanakyensis]TGK50486.1 hypothetical protein EHQ11_12440 [Leptospira kanakyensis]TGK63913.1 hypothetical protein EHQ16_05580 [Leptospira kanakyensis]TGK69624.1 hypothetical protein EHQ18_12600 [Leptospira kanakyensis]
MDQTWLKTTLERFKNEQDPIRKFLKETKLFEEALANQEFEKTDLLVRKELGALLSTFKESFRKLEEGFVAKAQIQNIGKTNPATTLLDRIIMKVSSAGYGMNGLGTGVKATSAEIEKLLNHDFSMLEKAGVLQKEILETLPTAFATNPEAAIESTNKLLLDFETQFESRNSIFLK